MGFAHLPQWQRHQVEKGICVRCQMTVGYEGMVCTKGERGTPNAMLAVGDVLHATDCRAEEHP